MKELDVCLVRTAPRDLPGRLVCYSYAVDKLFGPQTDSSAIEKIAIGLLDLAIKSLDDGVLGLVFVARDLGGSVLKSALVEASDNPAYVRVLQSTALIMFAGTPHQSTARDGWSETLLRLFYAESKTLPGPWIPSQLQFMSEFHRGLATEFGEVFRTNKFQVLNFYQKPSSRDEYNLVIPEDVSTFVEGNGVFQVGHYRRHGRVGELYLLKDHALFIRLISDSTARRQDWYDKALRLLARTGGFDHLNVQTRGGSRLIFTNLCGWLCDSSSFSSWLDGTSESSQILSLQLDGLTEDTSILTSPLIASIQKRRANPMSQFNTLAHHHPRPIPMTKAQLMAQLCSQILSLNPTFLNEGTEQLLLLPNNEMTLQTHNESSKENLLWRVLRPLFRGPLLGQMFIIIHIPPDSSLSSSFLDLVADFSTLAKGTEIRFKVLVMQVPSLPDNRPSLAHGGTILRRAITMDESGARTALKKDIIEEIESRVSPIDRAPTRVIAEAVANSKYWDNMDLYMVQTALAIIAQHGLLLANGLSNVRLLEEASIGKFASLVYGLMPPPFLHLIRTGLLWMTHAARPLTCAELGEVLTLGTDESGQESELPALVVTKQFVTMMYSLVEVQGEVVFVVNLDICHEIFRLVEEDQRNRAPTKESEGMLEAGKGNGNQFDGHIGIAQACLAYLEKGVGTEQNPAVLLPLLQYAVEHWLTHLKLSRQETAIFEAAAVSRFLADKDRVGWWLDRRQLYRAATISHVKQHESLTTRRLQLPSGGLLSLADTLSYETSNTSEMIKLVDLVLGATTVRHIYNLELWPSLIVAGAQSNNLDALSRLGRTDHLQDMDNATFFTVFETGTETALCGLVQSYMTPWLRQEIYSIVSIALWHGRFGLMDMLLAEFSIDFGNFEPPLIIRLAMNESPSPPLPSDLLWDALKTGIDSESNGQTVIHAAASSGYTALLHKLLSTISEPTLKLDCQDGAGLTALHWAAIKGHITVTELLLATEALNIELQDNNGSTPLYVASAGGHVRVVTALLQRDASIGTKDHKNRTPLHIALMNGHLRTSMLLLDKLTSSPEQRESNDLEAEDSMGCSALMLAVRGNLPQVVKSLMMLDVDASRSCASLELDRCPLHLAAELGFCDILDQLLLAPGNAAVNKADKLNHTPLHRAAFNGEVEAVKKLIRADSNLGIEDWDGKSDTPLSVACQSGNVAVTRILLQATTATGSKLSDNKLDFLLYRALSSGDSDTVRLVLDAGANKNKKWVDGSPLHLTAYGSSPRLVELLLLKQVDLEQRDWSERTALMNAA